MSPLAHGQRLAFLRLKFEKRMNSAHKKALTIAGQGDSVRATGQPYTAPVALRNTATLHVEASRHESRV